MRNELEHPDKKAKELLMSVLTPAQRKEVQSLGHFTVKGSRGNTYVIHTSYSPQFDNNVSTEGSGLLGSFLWTQYEGYFSRWDSFLAQKLAIETDEFAFLTITCGCRPQWFYDEYERLRYERR